MVQVFNSKCMCYFWKIIIRNVFFSEKNNPNLSKIVGENFNIYSYKQFKNSAFLNNYN